MIDIAHISDIHFGNNFSQATWNSVVNTVINFDPHLIVVSGDLVDHPSPEHLLAAKGALRDMLERTRANSNTVRGGKGREAELIVIPGNHDVFESGVAVGLPRLGWFEKIFHGKTDAAEKAMLLQFNVASLGFNPVFLGFEAGTRPQDAGWRTRLRAWTSGLLSARIIAAADKADDFAALLGEADPSPRVSTPASSPILLALLDSNPTQKGWDAASGLVDNDELLKLKDALAEVKTSYVARIAVVHHHVLPVAFAHGSGKKTGEPMMVLRNAGAVLRILADHKFDLILHGHWHKSQFARIDFGISDADSYPMTVASAGSAAMTSSDDVRANSLNLIKITATGQIEVKCVDYGGARAPTPNGTAGQDYRIYKEPLSDAKRRAFVRARERHPIECKQREQIGEVTENGDFWLIDQVDDLQVIHSIPSYPQRPFGMYIPPYGHFVRDTLALDDKSIRAGATLEPAPSHPDWKAGVFEHYWINLPGGGLTPGSAPVSFAIRSGCANCLMMTRWEALERVGHGTPKPGFDYEWVGALVSYPTRTLILKVKFPPALAMVQVYVECRRPRQYPLYKVDQWGDAKMPDGDMVIDPDVQEEEQKHLRFKPSTRTWTLKVDRPIVGYEYNLRWQVPGERIDRPIAGVTREWQKMLLNLGDRIDNHKETANDLEAVRQFELLCGTLARELCISSPDEKWTVAFFVYDSKNLALRPIFSRRSQPDEPLPRSFKIPYGDGVSGAAFQQRRIIAWNRGAVTSDPRGSARSLITPVPYPDSVSGPADAISVLALPVYHSGSEEVRQPPPWTAVGVVTIDSSSDASPINAMDDAQRRRLRLLAQVQMDKIVQAVRGTGVAAPLN
jgi:3',5'-cyclic AMP phosphodiesterase CpdA